MIHTLSVLERYGLEQEHEYDNEDGETVRWVFRRIAHVTLVEDVLGLEPAVVDYRITRRDGGPLDG